MCSADVFTYVSLEEAATNKSHNLPLSLALVV